jgi:uncharacterized protein YbaP (TraB family)
MMKRFGSIFFFSVLSFLTFAQSETRQIDEKKTLLWKISGNGLAKPSYLYGTIHMLCAEDAVLSDSLRHAINRSDEVYLEVDISNIFEMLGAFGQMKMRDDTTLADLLSGDDYNKVKSFFESKSPLLPFMVVETLKPILAATTLAESSLSCESMTAMEQMISEEAEKNGKEIKGLETMSYQAGILDSIPYKLQAMELVRYIDNFNSGGGDKEFDALMDAYKKQDLAKLEELMMKSDVGVNSYTDILLYKKNINWVKKLKTILSQRAVVIAVGAGHLPGEKGVINLLRKEGFTVSPVDNKLVKVKTL